MVRALCFQENRLLRPCCQRGRARLRTAREALTAAFDLLFRQGVERLAAPAAKDSDAGEGGLRFLCARAVPIVAAPPS